MSALLLSLATFFSTLIGGLFGLRYRDHLNLILGFTAGVLVGLVSFDLLPEIFRLVYTLHLDSTGPMLALWAAFFFFISSKSPSSFITLMKSTTPCISIRWWASSRRL